MFENYRPGVQVGNNCDCHKPSPIIPEHFGPAKVTKDKLGNITKLQWAPDARFTINITSDTSISIIEGSQVLNKAGMTPHSIPGWEGLHVYNIVDAICWKYCNGEWIQLPELVSSNDSNVVVVFGNDNATTKLSIKNFRGETIFSDSNSGSFVPLTIDDSLAGILQQGFYYLDVYQIATNSTRLVRRIPLSIAASQPQVKPTFPTMGHCHENKGFATDNTLNLKNGVLSVNVAESCQPGGTLPVSGNAVFEYAQPRNLVVEADIVNKTASMNSVDIYNYVMFGGEVTCLVNNVYLSLMSISVENATFKELLLDGNIIKSYLLTIDNVGKIINYNEYTSPINSSEDINNFKESLLEQMNSLSSTHLLDIQRMDSTINNTTQMVQSMKEQIGDLKVSEKIAELYINNNEINSAINNINSELDSKVGEQEVSELVTQKVDEELSSDELKNTIKELIDQNTNLDGGVVED